VPHVRLVNKLEAHGTSGNVSQWIAERFQGRQQTQTVVLNGSVLKCLHVLRGVI